MLARYRHIRQASPRKPSTSIAERLRKRRSGLDAVASVAAKTIMSVPKLHASRGYTGAQIGAGGRGAFITTALLNGFPPGRIADLVTGYDLYYVPGFGGSTGAPHFSPLRLNDNHVRFVFFGLGVKPGTYRRNITVHEIAPSLASAPGVEIHSGAFGNVLPEIAP